MSGAVQLQLSLTRAWDAGGATVDARITVRAIVKVKADTRRGILTFLMRGCLQG
jgi:hypothetical protein